MSVAMAEITVPREVVEIAAQSIGAFLERVDQGAATLESGKLERPPYCAAWTLSHLLTAWKAGKGPIE